MNLNTKYKVLKIGKKIVSDKIFNVIAHYYLHLRKNRFPKRLKIKHPITFNEKIIWNKLNNRFKGGELLADKYEVRKFVANTIGEEYLIPLIGIYSKVDEIDFSTLPEKFVVKATQGSGLNLIVKDKSKLDIESTKKLLNEWLKIDYSIFGREWQYDIKTNKIIIEAFISDDSKGELKDYKYFCFNGTPKYIQLDLDRFLGHKRNFYDLNWNIQPFTIMHSLSDELIEKPGNLDKMNALASKISEVLKDKMNFCRVDFYNIDGQILFGEITFHPAGGCEPFSEYKYDIELGQMIKKL